ncbi:MAG: DUF2269 domain-containing protein [Alphaproteobacteria bacterium]|nr:DUF2269 domain-containing protein [Alphaproteobacteria bacterium]
MTFLFFKWLHIISATLIFGTAIGSAFYVFAANRSRDTGIIYFASKYAVITNWLFLMPAIIIQLFTGVILMSMAGYSLSEGWVTWSLALYSFVVFCWGVSAWLQVQMRNHIARAVVNSIPPTPTYWRFERLWLLMGCMTFPAIILLFILMIFRP